MTKPSIQPTGAPAIPINDRIFGSFVEHLGRSIYGGIYEPGSPYSDEDGYRTDVLDLVKELGVTSVRYPGGNFVSGYEWEDGIGPVEERPTRLCLAWHTLESNRFGLHEFMEWVNRSETEPMMAINLGTRGIADALNLLEYCNVPGGTKWSELRRKNGADRPFDITFWCLGNEMDGKWQIGHRSATDYSVLAERTASAMLRLDNRLELVACGSSNAQMPTFGQWEETVMQHLADDISHVSCHAYYEEKDGDAASFLASGVDMDHFINTVAKIIERTAPGSPVRISFDEWNVWYQSRWNAVEGTQAIDDWPLNPPLLEDQYNVKDAVVVGSLLICLLRNADVVTAASLAQLVNVIAPIRCEPDVPAWRQTTFYPFAITAALAKGGTVVPTELNVGTVDTQRYGQVPSCDAVQVTQPGGGEAIFAVNRSLTEQVTFSFPVPGSALPVAQVISDADLEASNTASEPLRVVPKPLPVQVEENIGTVALPVCSWVALQIPG